MQVIVACELCKPPTELKGEYGDDFAHVIARHYAAFHPKESRITPSPQRDLHAAKPDALPPLSEADFQTMVVDTARFYGWKDFSLIQSAAISAKTGKVISMVTKRGWPDLVLVKGDKIIFWELKADRGRLDPEQREWLTALEAVEVVHQVGCVRPSDWESIEATLRG